MNQKPILFLDFDRTLFDTERYYEWLGEPRKEKNQELIDGVRALPDFAQFLFPDVVEFLDKAKERFTLVLLSYVKLDYSPRQTELQQSKIDGSGIAAYCVDVIVTSDSKADEAAKYLAAHDGFTEHFAFIDDEPAHLSLMKRMHPTAFCIRLERAGKKTGVKLEGGQEAVLPDHIVSNLRAALTVLESFK